MRRATAAAALCATAACLSTPIPPRFPSGDFVVPTHVRVRFVEGAAPVVREIALEEYVRATALSEFAPAAGEPADVGRMLEVQAIISRTYAVANVGRHAREGFDLCATTHCQLFDPRRLETSRWAPVAEEAARETTGAILRFRGTAAQALFHADCGGHTSDPAAVWGGTDRPYLHAAPDDGVPDETHGRWEHRVGVAALGSALDADPRTRAQGDIVRIDVEERDRAGRIRTATIERAPIRGAAAARTLVRGDVLREILSRAFGARAIRSTLFEVRREWASFVFSGRGFGHGVGLCQAGALARLRAGSPPLRVLTFYYPGTTLEKGH
jgi:stage II sporulation protein D